MRKTDSIFVLSFRFSSFFFNMSDNRLEKMVYRGCRASFVKHKQQKFAADALLCIIVQMRANELIGRITMKSVKL